MACAVMESSAVSNTVWEVLLWPEMLRNVTVVCTVMGSAVEACTVMSVDVACTTIVHKCCCCCALYWRLLHMLGILLSWV